LFTKHIDEYDVILLFLNEGSGKTKRDRELASFFFVIAEIVRRPFLFQAYDPET
jgi:hypothetical protein